MSLARALRGWRRAVGAANVVTDPAALAAAETATFRTTQRIPAIVRPRGRTEVQACLRIANRFRVPVHPVSRGKNWGYGSRVPVQDGAVLLDLGRMNRIVAFDEQLACVTIEPGVTFRQLHQFLRARRSRLRANPTGSTPESSPLANALERGLGRGNFADRFTSICGFEVVLPNGSCVSTGFARLPGARAAALHRWGVGPYVDGLFSQSNLGVVTRATLWLSPIPEQVDLLKATLARGADLVRFIDALRPLFQRGVIRNAVTVKNDYSLLSVVTQYPWSVTGGCAPLSHEIVDRLVPRPAPWVASVVLEHATARHRAPARRLISKALGAVCDRVVFRSDERIGADELEELHRPMSAPDLAATYWRKREKPPNRLDPDRDSCGEIWCAPVVPLRGRDVALATGIIESTAAQARFEPMTIVTILDGRAAHIVSGLYFDRTVPGEDARALEWARNAISSLARHGYYPYRLGVQSMRLLPPMRHDDAAFRRTLKRALDPNEILSPGRYGN